MALDGVSIKALQAELHGTLAGGKISKIAQPEKDELLITIKNKGETFRLDLCASPSLPYSYLTDKNKTGPDAAPAFCMLLRKHLAGGTLLQVTQPGLERILSFEIEHMDEMGDRSRRWLHVELMGKHSNLILCDQAQLIMDSIKRIPAHISSIREVLPGRPYFIAQTTSKEDPLTVSEEAFYSILKNTPLPLGKAFYQNFTGFSPILSEEILFRSGLDSSCPAAEIPQMQLLHLYRQFHIFMDQVRQNDFTPVMIRRDQEPLDFFPFSPMLFDKSLQIPYPSMSGLLEAFFADKGAWTRIRTKSADLRHIVQRSKERLAKKLILQEKQMADTEKRETYRIYGELLTSYAHSLPSGEKKADLFNYYTNQQIQIPLDSAMSPLENGKRYFARYTKAKRTYEALSRQMEETRQDLDYISTVEYALDHAKTEEDLLGIRQELKAAGFVRKGEAPLPQRGNGKKQKGGGRIGSPLHYISSDGYDMYVGKNNLQNEWLSFQMSEGNDLWFHAKGVPGSHVLVKTKGQKELPDRVYEEAGSLAAFYSQSRDADKVEVDYLLCRGLKKPAAGKPGLVIYHSNYSLVARPVITSLKSE